MHIDFESVVTETINRYNMLEETARVIVGFSGGADSVSLLYFLNYFIKKTDRKIEIIPVHINHGIRGEEANRDENFAREFCNKLGMNLIVVHEDVEALAVKNKISTEEAGRNVRYRVFRRCAEGLPSKIAVAHTLSDSCETIILNLIRGTGPKGLCGIPPTRENIIRPLISVTRAQVEEYCLKNSLNYINDSTNFESVYTRNKIRLEIIPLIKKINPNFEYSAKRLMTVLNENEIFLDTIAERAFIESYNGTCYDISRIENLDDTLKSRVAHKILSTYFEKPVENKHVNLLLNVIKNHSGAINVSKDLKIVCDGEKLFAMKQKNSKLLLWKKKMNIGKNFLTNINSNVIIKIISADEFKDIEKAEKKNNIWFINYDSLPGECYFRTRQYGDRFTFKNRGITKSFKKIFNELKIPAKERSKIPILACEDTVIWSKCVGVSKEYAIKKGCKKILILKLEEF